MKNNNILTLKIKPVDTLFFRDGKPFSMGDDSWADGIFPPPPNVIYGSIRSWMLANNKDINIENVIEKTENLEILDFYYVAKGITLLPLPNDYATKKNKDDQTRYNEQFNQRVQVERFKIIENSFISSIDTKYLIFNDKDYPLDSINEAYISKEKFIEYLKNENSEKFEAYLLDKKLEAKIGIKRTNETLATEEGNLYRIEQNRVSDFYFMVRIKSELLSDNYKTLLKLGGEGKVAIIDEFVKGKKGATRLRINTGLKTDKLLVYLATPSIFTGKYPDISKKIKINATFVGASVGKVLNIGGFDMKKGKPKIMYRAVPAGSIYLFELDEKIDIDNFQGIKISDKLTEQGFGIAYFGTFKI